MSQKLPTPRPGPDAPRPTVKPMATFAGKLAITDRDSIYWSKERYRIIPQQIAPLWIQYLLIDSFENEIIGTHAKLSDAMAQRDELDPMTV